MATLVSDQLRWLADQVIHHLDYNSAVLSGLAPDASHLASGGFHCSVVDLRAHGNQNDYSNTRPNDRDLNIRYGAAVDISMSKPDMIRAFGRVHTVWADKNDPRRKYVNAINGWDGSGDATRLDFDAGVAKYASPDHQWHVHVEFHRRYVLDAKAARAVVSIFQGEPKAAWTAREEPAPAPLKPATGVTMLPIDGVLPQLSKGMKDPVGTYNMIARLQKLLGVTADGVYGAGTVAAVKAYDAKTLGRTTDGSTVDAVLWKRLYGITAK